MRAIKFRAWDALNGKMVFVSSVSFKKTGEMWFASPDYTTSGNVEIVVDGKLMQFTGLKDMNGEDIYEGDIVIEQDHEKKFMEYRSVVEFKNGCFILMCKNCPPDWNPEYWPVFHDDFGTECKIIGNIYENPSLLEIAVTAGK